jgi:plasmid stability protein
MSTMIQIRNVPDELHRRIKARAALAGMSMSQYILLELERALERPTRVELLERIAELPAVEAEPPPATLMREDRERH